MLKVERFFELKKLWRKSSEEEQYFIERELIELTDSLSEQEQEELASTIARNFEREHNEYETLKTAHEEKKNNKKWFWKKS